MRLLDISYCYPSQDPKDISGIHVHRQLRGLRQKDWDIRVITSEPFLYRRLQRTANNYPFYQIREGIFIWRSQHVYIPRFFTHGWLFDRIYSQGIMAAACAALEDWKPDLVVCDWIVPCGYAARVIADQLNIPLIAKAHGEDVRLITAQSKIPNQKRNYLLKFGLRAHSVICNGDGLSNALANSGVIAKEKIFTVPIGVDTEQFFPPTQDEKLRIREKLGLRADALIWLFVGRWEIAKGSAELTNAMIKLLNVHRDIHFVQVGPINDAERAALLTKLGSNVRFVGPVEPDKVALYTRASDAFVLPSHKEGLPSALLEAMACGLAPVVTPVGGIPSVINHDYNGILVSPQNAESLYEALTSLTSAPMKVRMLGEKAWLTVTKGGYALLDVVNRLHQLYSEAIGIV